MLIVKDRLERVPIMSLQTGAQIAETAQVVIDPRQLKVVAFYCRGPRLDVNPALLITSDIREFGSMGMIVDSADVLVSPDDLVRLKEVLDFKFVLEGKPVIDTAGHKLGHVTNYDLDSITLYIVKLHLQPGIFKAWTTSEFLVDRTQVVEVTDEHVVVRDTRKRKAEKIKAPVVAPVLENPFRRAPLEGTSTPTQK